MHAGSFGSDYCQRAAGLFVCQSNFPVCDQCQHGRSYLASREECERLSMAECHEEWTGATQYGISLPNCTDLPSEELIGEDDRYGNWANAILFSKLQSMGVLLHTFLVG